jgi:hypothetical protein
VIGAAGAVAPLPALIVLSGAGVVLLAIAAPRTMVGLTALVVLFVRPLEHLVLVAELGYLDEALIGVCAVTLPLRRLAARQSLRTFPGQWWFAGFAAAGLLSGLFLDVPPSVYFMGALVVCKGMIFAWAVAQVDWTERDLTNAARVGVVVIVFGVVATAVNLAIPAAWSALLASDLKASAARSFLPSVIGPFTHPLDLGQFMTLSAIALVAWRTAVRKTPLTMALMIATAVGSVLSARRTAIVSLAVAWVWIKAKARAGGVLLAIAVCVPAALVALAGPLTAVVTATYDEYVTPRGSPAARTVLTVDSFDVAADHFPAGAGFGRFGSAIAATTYSPEYLKRGYQDVWGLGRTAEQGRFLTDTEWPAVIGESGFLGAIAFALGLAAIYRAGARLYASRRAPVVRWAGLLTIGWLIACLVQSIATVSFTGPPVYALFFGLVGIVAVLSKQPEAAPDETAPDEAGERRERTPSREERPAGRE